MHTISGHKVLDIMVRVVGDGNHYRFDFRVDGVLHQGTAYSKTGAISRAYNMIRDLGRSNKPNRSA